MKKKKSLVCMKYVFQDCFRAFPMMMMLLLVLEILSDVFLVLLPAVLAEVVEGAASGGGYELMPEITLFACLLITGPLLSSVYRWSELVLGVKSEQYFGRKMFAFSKQIQLEELENTEVLDRFKRAERAMQNNPAVDLLRRMLNIVGSSATCVGVMFVVGSYSLWLPAIALAGTIPNLLVQAHGTSMWIRLRRMQSTARRRMQYLWELLTRKEAVKEMRTLGFAAYIKEKWSRQNVQLVKENQEVEQKLCGKGMISECVANLFMP